MRAAATINWFVWAANGSSGAGLAARYIFSLADNLLNKTLFT
jgi:hypothetical protein